MANNTIQVKRTSTTGRTPNTTNSSNSQYIAAGELALNMTDGILYSSNGSVLIEVGANNTNQNVSNTLTVKAISANGSNGTSGQVLFTNGTAAYWNTAASGTSNLQVQNTNPSTPNNGVVYWNNDIGKLLIYYTDGTSNQWVEAAIGGGVLGAKGANTNIQFNDSGFANGSANFIYDKTANLLTVAGQNINSSGIYVAGVVNSTSYTVGTTFVANTTTLNSNGAVINSTGAFITGTVNATSHTVGSSFVGNSSGITFGSSTRITGDFTNATINNRTAFVTSTLNEHSSVYVLPNGTAGNSYWQAANSSNPTNASKIRLGANGSTEVLIASDVNGTGTYLPLSFYNNNTLQGVLSANGNWGFGNSTPADKLSVNGTGYFGANLTVINVYSTGTVNAVAHIVGTSSIVNATGVYTTGTVNAATLSVGTNFIANATTLFVSNTTGNVTIVPYGITVAANGLGYVTLGNSTINSTLTASSLVITNATSTAQTVAGAVIVSNATVNVVVANVTGVTVTPNTGFTLGSNAAPTNGANGYTWLPNGIMVQWFRASVTNAAAQALALPTTFPSNGYSVVATTNSNAQTAAVTIKASVANGTHVLANSIGVNTSWNFVVFGN